MSLNVDAGLRLGGNESYPDIFQPFDGSADDTPIEDGFVGLPKVPGLGLEAKSELLRTMREVADT